MKKRGSPTDDTITYYAPKTIRSAPVTPCDSETSTWSDRPWPKPDYDVSSMYEKTSYKGSTSYDRGIYDLTRYNKTDDVPTGYDAGYDKSMYEPSTSASYKGEDNATGYEKGATSYDKASYDGSTGYDTEVASGSSGYDKASYEASIEGVWWWRRPLGVRRMQCRSCGESSSTRPLRMTPCTSGMSQGHDDDVGDRRPLMSRDRPLLFVRQLFL